MAGVQRFYGEFKDVGAGFLRGGNFATGDATLDALVSAVQPATNANLAIATLGVPAIGVTTPEAALYQSVQDVLVVTLRTAINTYVQYSLPAPVGSMFKPGGVEVDPTSSIWMALLAALQSNLSDAAGNAAANLVSASKTSRRVDQNGDI